MIFLKERKLSMKDKIKAALIVIGIILLFACLFVLVFNKHYITAIIFMGIGITLLIKLADAIDFGD